ncbi:MAG: nucleotidyltransferase domain-containing protein [Candidatus Nanopelagicaceae bacterium]|nr:nucleotidyltransferase domain-containing protein [Candidatus Nanopelagicaceae bacterium]
MNLNRPLTSLIPTLEGEVLTVLAGAQTSFTGLQVQTIIGKYSPRGVRNALQRLCVQGIVTRRPVGAADLYELNPEHLMTKYIKSLVSLRSEFLELLKKEVAVWGILPVCGAVFGSAVRSDMKPESDIDIFIVRPKTVEFDLGAWREQLADLSRKIDAWTGNDAQIFELDEDGIDLELASKDGVLYSIIDQGILFYGTPNYLRSLRHKKASNSTG